MNRKGIILTFIFMKFLSDVTRLLGFTITIHKPFWTNYNVEFIYVSIFFKLVACKYDCMARVKNSRLRHIFTFNSFSLLILFICSDLIQKTINFDINQMSTNYIILFDLFFFSNCYSLSWLVHFQRKSSYMLHRRIIVRKCCKSIFELYTTLSLLRSENIFVFLVYIWILLFPMTTENHFHSLDVSPAN